MSYHVLDPDTLSASPDHPCDRRSITEAAGLHALQFARYTLTPGEDLATDYHYHDRREEVFYVIDGTLFVETPGRTYEVPAGRLFAALPGHPLRPYNPETATAPVRVLGLGAPAADIGLPYRSKSPSQAAEETDPSSE